MLRTTWAAYSSTTEDYDFLISHRFTIAINWESSNEITVLALVSRELLVLMEISRVELHSVFFTDTVRSSPALH